MDNPISFFVNNGRKPRFVRGDVFIDDAYSRLYVVLRSSRSGYQTMIITDWSNDNTVKDYPGKICSWGFGVEDDQCVGHVELPSNMG